ncbi:hypothetical protein H2248_001417 [Termitomyces sp. 'cryptogamus']|nr:hypothetical protein H2248_001417 [Termitomyces sp. 'cryptogamus']
MLVILCVDPGSIEEGIREVQRQGLEVHIGSVCIDAHGVEVEAVQKRKEPRALAQCMWGMAVLYLSRWDQQVSAGSGMHAGLTQLDAGTVPARNLPLPDVLQIGTGSMAGSGAHKGNAGNDNEQWASGHNNKFFHVLSEEKILKIFEMFSMSFLRNM